MFWKNVKSYFSDTGSNSTEITLVEKDMIINYEKNGDIMNSILLALHKPSISSKDTDSDCFHDRISIKKTKEIYPEIVLSLNQLLKTI